MPKKSESHVQLILPHDGCSRWSQISKFSPVCRETFRRLSIEGKAPKPIRMGIRCTFYQNKELHKFFANPLTYKSEEP